MGIGARLVHHDVGPKLGQRRAQVIEVSQVRRGLIGALVREPEAHVEHAIRKAHCFDDGLRAVSVVIVAIDDRDPCRASFVQ